ncbi:hypothetical protein C0995_001511 [Termitomyces sp. Mi166|nr:hypothetical protein C0995_001511 [Termitomyces sp. Mi166\
MANMGLYYMGLRRHIYFSINLVLFKTPDAPMLSRLHTRLISTAAPKPALKYPFFVARNSRGNLPVYTDVRNGGTRYLVLVRNIDGKPDALASELSRNLFPKDSPEAARIQVEVHRSNIIVKGGRWKNDVVKFLQEKGF